MRSMSSVVALGVTMSFIAASGCGTAVDEASASSPAPTPAMPGAAAPGAAIEDVAIMHALPATGHAAPLQSPVPSGRASGALPAKPQPLITDRAHRLDLTNVGVPVGRVEGRIAGQPFMLERAELHRTTGVILLHGTDGQTIFVFMFLRNDDTPAGETWNVLAPSDDFDQPHVHVHYRRQDGDTRSNVHTRGFVMRLQFGELEDGSIPGRIYLCLPDEKKSFVAGRFTIPLDD
jgi:hypothetical protein